MTHTHTHTHTHTQSRRRRANTDNEYDSSLVTESGARNRVKDRRIRATNRREAQVPFRIADRL